MGVCGQLHTPETLQHTKELMVPKIQEAGSTPQLHWHCGEDTLASAGNPISGHSHCNS